MCGLSQLRTVQVWFVTSFLRLPRVLRLIGYYKTQAINLDVPMRRLQISKFALLVYLVPHWVGCMFFLISRLDDFGPETWPVNVQAVVGSFGVQTASTAERYLMIMWKGVNAMTNLGYESIRPKTTVEIVWTCVMYFLQTLLASYILGTLFHYMTARDHNLENFRRKISMLQNFMRERNLPRDLRGKLVSYLEFHYAKSKHTYSGFSLPRTLQLRVALSKHQATLDSCTRTGGVLRGCTTEFLHLLLVHFREVYLMPGEVFVRGGDIGRWLGLVDEGDVDVVDHLGGGESEEVVTTVYGSVADMEKVVGELGFFLNMLQPYSAVRAQSRSSVLPPLGSGISVLTCRALTSLNSFPVVILWALLHQVCGRERDARLLVLDKEDYNTISESYPEQQDIIVRNLLARFDLDSRGDDAPGYNPNSDEAQEMAALRAAVRAAIIRRQDALFSSTVYAVTMGDVEEVVHTLQKGVDVNMTNYDHRTLLHRAASEGSVKMIEALLDEGAEKGTPSHRTGPSLLCFHRSLRSYLIPESPLPCAPPADELDLWQQTPLHQAVIAKQMAAVEYLTQRGARLRLENPAAELCAAASGERIDDIKRLVHNGAVVVSLVSLLA